MNEPELRDIRLPAEGFWWPPAPGWWLLLSLLIAAVVALAWWRRRRRRPSARRLLRRELEAMRRGYRRGNADTGSTVNAVARLLRRTLIGYRGRREAAASTGDAWLAQLEELTPHHGFSPEQLSLLARGRYRPDIDCDVEALLGACEDWIRNLPGEPRHAAD
jgi:hypothetical protein